MDLLLQIIDKDDIEEKDCKELVAKSAYKTTFDHFTFILYPDTSNINESDRLSIHQCDLITRESSRSEMRRGRKKKQPHNIDEGESNNNIETNKKRRDSTGVQLIHNTRTTIILDFNNLNLIQAPGKVVIPKFTELNPNYYDIDNQSTSSISVEVRFKFKN
jgi:hypothetical protein